jgi:hypothetical protein
VESTRIGDDGDYRELGGIDGYAVTNPRQFIESFAKRVYAKMPAFF